MRTLNIVEIKPIPLEHLPPEKIQGYEVFEEPYANVFFMARKKQGKTTAMWTALKRCISRSKQYPTTVHFYIGSIYRDPSYKYIIKELKKRGVPYSLNSSLFDENKADVLAADVKQLEEKYKEDLEAEFDDSDSSDTDNDYYEYPYGPAFGGGKYVTMTREELLELALAKGAEPLSRKPKPPKKIAPEDIFVFDDLGQEINHSPSLCRLMKENRHLKSKVFICSQWLNDVPLQARSQLDYLLMWSKVSEPKLAEVFSNLDLPVDFDDFRTMYYDATAEPHGFLYIDVVNGKFRKGFSKKDEYSLA